MRIGFLGIGNMGKPMALNLLRGGYAVYVYDVVAPSAAAFTALGGVVCDTAPDAVRDADIVLTMLPHGESVSQVWREVLFPTLAGRESLLVDCSTIDVVTAQRLHAEAEARGFLCLDAPVSGGVSGAEAGGLTFMCGGSDTAFARCEALLSCMGKHIFHCGAGGMGQAAKICNNMMLAPQMIAVCESFALAEKLGLSAEKLFSVSAVSSGQCWSLTSYCPWPGLVGSAPSSRGYRSGFAAALMLKDLRLSQEAARAVGVVTPFAARACEAFAEFVAEAGGDIDFSAIMDKVRRG